MHVSYLTRVIDRLKKNKTCSGRGGWCQFLVAFMDEIVQCMNDTWCVEIISEGALDVLSRLFQTVKKHMFSLK